MGGEGLTKEAGHCAGVTRAILQHPGVLDVQANPVSGRVLVTYSPEYLDLNIESLLRDNLQKLSHLEFSEIRVAKKSNALTSVLKSSLPKREKLIYPFALSVLGHSLHILQGLSFIGTVNTARGEGPFPERFGAGQNWVEDGFHERPDCVFDRRRLMGSV